MTGTLSALQALLDKAAPHVERIIKARSQTRSPEAPKFNIFEITRRGHYEVTTHSRLLAHLLDPLGDHNQGNLFLSAFLGLIGKKDGTLLLPPADTNWRVRCENDYIDILLVHHAPPAAETQIIIENKWSAPDRRGQLFAYWSRQHNKTGGRLERIPVIYLTPEGRRPALSKRERDSAVFVRDIIMLSYRHDWYGEVTRLLPEVRAPVVAETLRQYVDLMEALYEN